MNIAHLVPQKQKFPLEKHNGRYAWVLQLAQYQAAAGHEVTIYCAEGSYDKEPRLHFSATPTLFESVTLSNIAHIKQALTHTEHDIFHSHYDYLHYFAATDTSKPFIFTQHWFPNNEIVRASRLDAAQRCLAVPVTQMMYRFNAANGIKTAKPIYHGIDLSLFRPHDDERPRERFVFVGRITPNKGVKEAIDIVLRNNVGLDIIGKIQPKDESYWTSIAPKIDGDQIRYLGAKEPADVAKAFQRAKALLFPSQQAEAFGLVTAEAQACGTPVIISNIGASHELIEHEVTGFVAKDAAGYDNAISKIDSISRDACQKRAQTFDINRMNAAYDELYTNLLLRIN